MLFLIGAFAMRGAGCTYNDIVDREFDQVLRMWMPYDAGFFLYQPHLRNMSALALRRTDGYGSPATARLWLDK